MDRILIGLVGIAIGLYINRRSSNGSLITIINKLNFMGTQLDEIKQELVDAGLKADKIQADVTKLTNAIGNTGETPTAAEWAEVKAQAVALNSKLQIIDDQTEDETTEPPE